jgi:hypothetical protein
MAIEDGTVLRSTILEPGEGMLYQNDQRQRVTVRVTAGPTFPKEKLTMLANDTMLVAERNEDEFLRAVSDRISDILEEIE